MKSLVGVEDHASTITSTLINTKIFDVASNQFKSPNNNDILIMDGLLKI